MPIMIDTDLLDSLEQSAIKWHSDSESRIMKFPAETYLVPAQLLIPRMAMTCFVAYLWPMFVLSLLLTPTHSVIYSAILSVMMSACFFSVWTRWAKWHTKRHVNDRLQNPTEYYTLPPNLLFEEHVMELFAVRISETVSPYNFSGKLILTDKALWFIDEKGRYIDHNKRIALEDITDFEIKKFDSLSAFVAGKDLARMLPGRFVVSANGEKHHFHAGTIELIAALVSELQPRLPGAAQVEEALVMSLPDAPLLEA